MYIQTPDPMTHSPSEKSEVAFSPKMMTKDSQKDNPNLPELGMFVITAHLEKNHIIIINVFKQLSHL